MTNMTPAVRRALGLEKKLPKRGAKYSENIPVPPPVAVVKESLTSPGPSVFDDLYQSLTGGQAGKVRRSPLNCPYPNNLCRGCRDEGVCEN